jgi:hypothetical protein
MMRLCEKVNIYPLPCFFTMFISRNLYLFKKFLDLLIYIYNGIIFFQFMFLRYVRATSFAYAQTREEEIYHNKKTKKRRKEKKKKNNDSPIIFQIGVSRY